MVNAISLTGAIAVLTKTEISKRLTNPLLQYFESSAKRRTATSAIGWVIHGRSLVYPVKSVKGKVTARSLGPLIVADQAIDISWAMCFAVTK